MSSQSENEIVLYINLGPLIIICILSFWKIYFVFCIILSLVYIIIWKLSIEYTIMKESYKHPY